MKVQGWMAAGSPRRPIAPVWKDEVHFTYPAQVFDTVGAIIVADGVAPSYGDALAAALR